MCLTLGPYYHDRANRKTFCKKVPADENGLVLLYKWVMVKNICDHSMTCYYSYAQEARIFLEQVNFSNRKSCNLSFKELFDGEVALGLHFFINDNEQLQIPTIYAVARMDDFVAYDGYNGVVFMQAIYTKDKPSKEKMKEYAKMLKEEKCAYC